MEIQRKYAVIDKRRSIKNYLNHGNEETQKSILENLTTEEITSLRKISNCNMKIYLYHQSSANKKRFI